MVKALDIQHELSQMKVLHGSGILMGMSWL